MNKFEAFDIKSIPHIVNSNTDMLANVVSNNDHTRDIFPIKLICSPLILNNNQQIFGDEQQIMDFLQKEVTNKGSVIGDEQHGALL